LTTINDQVIVILTPGFPKDEEDGTCLPLQKNFILAIKKNFPRQKMIILSFQYPYIKKTYSWNDITVIAFNGQNKGGLPKLLLRYKVNAALETIHKKNTISAVLSFWYGECAWVGKKFTGKRNIKNYCWLLGQDARAGNKYPSRTGLPSNEMIVLSDFLQNEFEKNYGIKPMYVVPPGIDDKEFDTVIPGKNSDIIAAGSLIPLKQYEVFIAVLGSLKKQLPGIKAILIGDGIEKNKLQALINLQGLQQNIILAGELSHKETLLKMQQAKIFLHPSSYEGFGVVNIEALYAGCQVISFCKPMTTDFAQWHTVTTKDEMYKKTLELLQDTDLKYERQLPFHIDDTAKKMMTVLGINQP
jgi:glycosyltransferase involved in cell wall biosynthesis